VSRPECPLWPGAWGSPTHKRALPGEGIAQHRAEQGQQLPLAAVEGRAAGAALHAFIYGVIVVANASVRLLVSLLVCTKNDLNAVPSFVSPW
jgi:hypothetical protein